jgi:hypothetical protein
MCIGEADCSSEGRLIYARTTCPRAVCVSWRDADGRSHAYLDGLKGCERTDTMHLIRCVGTANPSPDADASDFVLRDATLPSTLNPGQTCVPLEVSGEG